MGALENLVGGIPASYQTTGNKGIKTGGTLQRLVNSVPATPSVIPTTAQTIGQIPQVQAKPKEKSLWDHLTDFGNLYKQASETVSHALFGDANDYKRLQEVQKLVSQVKTTGVKPPMPKSLDTQVKEPAPSAQLKEYKAPSKTFLDVMDGVARYGKLVSGESLKGLTGGFINPEYDAPKGLAETITARVAETAGSVVSMSAIGEMLGAVSGGKNLLSPILSKYPKVAKIIFPLVKNALIFDIYGQLNPEVKDRLKEVAIDTVSSIPYALTGFIPKARFSVPASFALGFGMTKLEGGSNEDAIFNGLLLGTLDGVLRYHSGKGFVQGRAADRNLNFEAVDTLKRYSGERLEHWWPKDEITRVYKEAAKKAHPDMGGSEKAMREVNAAYEFLTGKTNYFDKIETGDRPAQAKTQKAIEQLEAQNKAETETAITQITPPKEYTSSVEKLAFENLMQDPVKYRDEYLQKNGNVVGGDNALDLFEGYNGTNSKDYQRAAGAVKSMALDKLLQTKQGTGNNTVLITAGGTGSAKSTAIINDLPNKADYPVIFDTTLISDRNAKVVEQALEKGYKVQITYVLRHPLSAWESALLRDRVVTEADHVDSHIRAREMILKLFEQYKGNKNVTFNFIDNTGKPEEIKKTTVDFIKNFKYNIDEVRDQIVKTTDEQYNQKSISEEKYKAITENRNGGRDNRKHEEKHSEQGKNSVKKDQLLKEAKKYPSPGNFGAIANHKYGLSFEEGTKIWNEAHNKKEGKPVKKKTIKSLDEKLNSLIGYSSGTAHWKMEYHIRNAMIDGALEQAPENVKKEIEAVIKEIDTMKAKRRIPAGNASPGGRAIGEYEQAPINESAESHIKKLVLKAKSYKKAVYYVKSSQSGGVYYTIGDKAALENQLSEWKKTTESSLERAYLKVYIPKVYGFDADWTDSYIDIKNKLKDGSLTWDKIKDEVGVVEYDPGATYKRLAQSVGVYDTNPPKQKQKDPEGIYLDYSLEDQAIRKWGETSDPHAAAFITSDGRYISGGSADNRLIDHREIAVSDLSGSDGLIDYMNRTKNIRIHNSGDSVSVDIVYRPTSEQIPALQEVMDGRKIYADISNSRGGIDASGEFDTFEDWYSWMNETINPPMPKRAPSGLASSGAQPLGVFEKGEPVESKNFKIFEEVKKLIEKYAKTVGEGYLPKGALGVYYSDTTNIRVNGMNNLSVAAHEITHFLDFHYNISRQLMGVQGYSKVGKPIYDSESSKLRKQITQLYTQYYPGGSKNHSLRKRTLEGFATLLQKFIEMPRQIETEFPDLVKEFLKPEGKYFKPVMGEIIKDLKKIVSEYQSLPALDKVGARVTSKALETKEKSFLNLWDKIRTTVEDEIWPTEKVAIQSGTHFTAEDPSIWLRAYQNAAGVYANNIRNGKTGYYGMNEKGEFVKLHDFNWKTLTEHLFKEKTTDSFGHYLVARDQYFHWQELDKLKKTYDQLLGEYQAAGGTPDIIDATTGKPLIALVRAARQLYNDQLKYLKANGFTRDEIEAAYLETKKDKRFDKEEEMYDILVAEDLKLLNHPLVQLVNNDTYTKLKSKEGYASMKRQVYDDIVGTESPTMNQPGKTKVGALKHRTGGERTIINPVLNGMTNHIEIVRKSMKQAIYNRFGDIAVKAILPELFQRTQLKPLVDANTGAISFPQERDPHIIMTRVNYKRVPILVDAGIKKVIDEALTYQTMNIFEHLLVTASRTFTVGTTGLYPQFALTNFTADQWNAIYNTRNGYTPLIDQLKILRRAVIEKGGKPAQYYEEWEVLGGDRMTLIQSQMGSLDQAQKYLHEETGRIRKALDLVNKGVDIFGTPSKISETVSRFAEYYKARESGKHQLVALEEAGRITAPFHHIGSWKIGDRISGKYVIRSIPFGNAAFQVLAQTIKTAEQDPKARGRLMFIMLTLLALSLGSLASVKKFGTKRQQEQYKDLDPVDLATYLHFPAIGGEGLYRIKMSPEMSTIAAVATMVMAQNIFGIKYRAEDYKQASLNFLPKQMNLLEPTEMFLSWLNPLIKIPFELIANIKDYPSIRPLENQTMQNTEPRYRYNEYTSVVAKAIGDRFNLSPVKIDFLMEGLGSRFVRFFSGKPGAYNPFSSGYREYYFTMGRRIENYYTDRTKEDQRLKALKDKLKSGTITGEEKKEGLKLQRRQAIYNALDDYLKYYRKIDEKKEKAKADLYRQKILKGLEMLGEK